MEQAARQIERRFRLHERGLLSDEELAHSVIDELAWHRAFELIEEFVRRLPRVAVAEAEKYARDILAPSWTTITWGVGVGPTREEVEIQLASLKQVAGRVLMVLRGDSTDERADGE